ncbi:hypothetical protein KAU93_05250 [Candidatus Bathyarchaeota archaeon]|nr:hypothetical protein [Candidatus Bathyarchaeota archaeon]
MGRIITDYYHSILIDKEKLQSLKGHARYQLYRRVSKRAGEALKDLTTIAEHLPEKHKTKVFNEENIIGLLNSIFTVKQEENEHIKNTGLFQLALTLREASDNYIMMMLGKTARETLKSIRMAELKESVIELNKPTLELIKILLVQQQKQGKGSP